MFIPLVFLLGLLGRIFREFSITLIVAIFASGLISLTLTPLMCSRVLAERQFTGSDVRLPLTCRPAPAHRGRHRQLTQELGKIPGIVPILRPNPVLQINIGATNQNAGRYAYTLSGINSADLCSAAVRWWASCANTPVS